MSISLGYNLLNTSNGVNLFSVGSLLELNTSISSIDLPSSNFIDRYPLHLISNGVDTLAYPMDLI